MPENSILILVGIGLAAIMSWLAYRAGFNAGFEAGWDESSYYHTGKSW